jgi:hypothetical protein
MRTVLAASLIALLTAPAYSQQLSTSGGRPSLGIPLGGETKTAPADPQSEEHENAYKSAIEKLPSKQKTSEDPWSGIRSTSSTQKTGR